MFAPGLIGRSINHTSIGQWMEVNFQDIFGLAYNILFGVLIIIFTFFYTAITVPTNKMADDLKRSGGFLFLASDQVKKPEIARSYLVLNYIPRINILILLAVLPAIVVKHGCTSRMALFYGGTSLLIMVGVAIDTVQQINAYLLNRHYDGLMKTGKQKNNMAKQTA